MPFIAKRTAALLALILILAGSAIFTPRLTSASYLAVFNPTSLPAASDNPLYLPFLASSPRPYSKPKVNLPLIESAGLMNQMAIFWFGSVTPSDNYVDVRAGYTQSALALHMAVVDRRLWCSNNSADASRGLADSIEIFLDTAAQPLSHLSASAYRFTGQLGSWDCSEYFTAYQGSGAGWNTVALPFTGKTGWRGNAPNDYSDDRGWTMDVTIPFTSLGLSAAPKVGTLWRLAVVVHNRNDSAATVSSLKQWPDGMRTDQPTTWGDLSFGLKTYSPPPSTQQGVITVRDRLGGSVVVDGHAGGGMLCGDGLDFWTQWGSKSYAPGSADNDKINIQNQGDIADWPCFSRYYVTFPLNAIPAGKVIVSAQLRMHLFGNSGGPADHPPRSLIQVFVTSRDFTEAGLTWNSAPQMAENISQAWVDPVAVFPGWPGVLYSWDVSRAVADSYAAGLPLRLALYSADEGYHSGKYFVSSDTGDWNAMARPELQIVIGQP